MIQFALSQRGGQLALNVWRLSGRHPEFGALGRDANCDQAFMAHNAVGFGGQCQTEAGQGCIAMCQTEAHPGGAFIGQFRFGEHCVLFQVGQLRLEQLAGHRHHHAVALKQDAEARLHSAFLRAAGAEAGAGVTQVIDIAGQLALQEFSGVRTANREYAFMRQGAEKSRIGHGSSQGK